MIQIDDVRWPQVAINYTGPLRRADHAGLTEAVAGFCARGERFGLLFETRPAGAPEPGLVKAQLAWLETESELLAQWVAGWATVIDPADRAALEGRRGAGIRSRMPFPQRSFSDVGQARAWLAERLSDPAVSDQADRDRTEVTP